MINLVAAALSAGMAVFMAMNGEAEVASLNTAAAVFNFGLFLALREG